MILREPLHVDGGETEASQNADNRCWRSYEDSRELFAGPADLDWAADRELLDHAVVDPWERHA